MADKAKVKLTSNFKRIDQEIGLKLEPAVIAACHVVRTEWMHILAGSRSGRRYRVPGTAKMYTASAPGEAPAVATGRLRQTLKVVPRISYKRAQARVGSPMEYAVYLEFGTESMEPRKHLSVAIANTKDEVERLIRGALS